VVALGWNTLRAQRALRDRLWDDTAAGRLRTRVAVDLDNALNSRAIQAYNQAFIVTGAG
jgi:hypothetical protein